MFEPCKECDKAMSAWVRWHQEMERRAKNPDQALSLAKQPSSRCSRHQNVQMWYGSSTGDSTARKPRFRASNHRRRP